ncbi:hypothetical protein SARC_12096 [Sphaeroforma arctica JP610]|uniref:Uncharacterized protein n=1 Tax=Sphaeroforma arctica JP610 TaxID=667725 RepID=A0A0L0FF23_9EUKA|nr:hypothetical protein SARC_12096 [Sphaeroforma arctica JP610]KNC75377.1 hypothetical protein SARC_12096 [Sphaeroforma arctica JP610]|eukprot:XP_014149279.1 hypothetical protein SARC_12096 [Sphaeroforma arctica JP610]
MTSSEISASVIKSNGDSAADIQQTHVNAVNLANGEKDKADLVQGILNQVQTRFQVMTDTVVEKIDSMGKQIDDLQTQIAVLEDQLKKNYPDDSADK